MKVFITVSLCCFLSSCRPATTSAEDYVQRLENILNVKGEASDIKAPKFPKPRDLKLDIKPSELSIREFLSLRKCKLHTTIAQRNSLMGKVAKPSQLLFNDIRILEQGPSCLAILNNSTLSNKLKKFLDKKQNELDQSLWYGLLAQDEHAKFWSIIDTNLSPNSAASLEALNVFVRDVRNGQLSFDDQQFDHVEQHLGKLRFANGGLLLQRYTQLINAMNRANSIVRQSLAKPLCLTAKPTTNAGYLSTVVDKFFIAKVQRDAIELNSLKAKFIDSHLRLEQQVLDGAKPAYRKWARQRDNLFKLGQSATTKHAKLLQLLYQQCGIEAGIQSSARRK